MKTDDTFRVSRIYIRKLKQVDYPTKNHFDL